MEIKLVTNNDNGGYEILHISNDDFENDNFVDIWVNEDQVVDVSIEELYTAVKAFYDHRTRAKDWDNKLK